MIVYVDGTERRVVESPFSRTNGTVADMFTGEKITLDVVPLREIEKASTTAYEVDDSYDADTFKVGVGVVDSPPVAGTYKIAYKTDTTSALSFDATAAEVEAALNDVSMSDLLTDSPSGVTVSGDYNSGYRITWSATGAVDDFSSDAVNLLPESVVAFTVERAGDTDVSEVVMLRLMKKQAGLTTSSSTIPSGSMSINEITTGSRKTREIFDITCVDDTAPIAQREEAKAVAVGGAFHVATLTTVADTSSNLDGDYFVLYDDEGSVAFWFDVDDNGTTIPAGAALLDRAVEITGITANDSDGVVANIVADAINNDSKFSATHDGNVVTVTYSTIGAHGSASAGTSGFTAATVTSGASSDVYDGTYFYLSALNADGTESIHAWYFSQNGTTDAPTAALALDSDLTAITYAVNDTAKAMASNIAASINTNTAFSAVASGSEIHIVHALAGDVSDMSAGDSPLTNLAVTENGADSSLDGKHFITYEDDNEGGELSRAFWFNISGNAEPSGTALNADRTTEITTIESGAKAYEVAQEVAAVIDALPTYKAIAKSTKINVESSEGYNFTDASAESSGFTFTKVQDGGTGTDASELVEVVFTQQAIGGVFTLSVDTGGGAQTTAGISWDATPEQIILELEGLPNVAANDVTVEGGLGGDFRIGFKNNLADKAITVTVDYDGVKWIAGKRFTLDLNTTSAYSLLYGLDSLACILEIEATRSSSYTVKLVHANVTLKNGLIDSTALSPSTQIDHYTEAEVDALIVKHEKTITSLTGGTAADLDSIDTTNITPDHAVFFYDADSAEFTIYVLKAGTNTESSPSIILPDDYDAGTNAKYWERVDLTSVTDHGELDGLADDDHTQYLLVDGTRAGTGKQELLALNFSNPTVLTLSVGAVTNTQTYHKVAAESGTTDTITTAQGSNSQGDILILSADTGDTITIQHGTGADGFHLTSEADLEISEYDTIAFIHNGTLWSEIGNAGTGADYIHSDVTFTGLVGGTAADLDSIDTSEKAVGYRQAVVGTDGRLYTYELQVPSLSTTTVSNVNTANNQLGIGGTDEAIPGQRFKLSTSDTLPAGLNSSTLYYVKEFSPSNNRMTVSTTRGGSAVSITTTGSGTHTITWIDTPFTVLPADYDSATNDKAWTLVAPVFNMSFEVIGPTTDHSVGYFVMPATCNHLKIDEVQCYAQSLPSGGGSTNMLWRVRTNAEEDVRSGTRTLMFAGTVSQTSLIMRAVLDDGETFRASNYFVPRQNVLDFEITSTGAGVTGTTAGQGAIITITGWECGLE
jgi:hypothetical protein